MLSLRPVVLAALLLLVAPKGESPVPPPGDAGSEPVPGIEHLRLARTLEDGSPVAVNVLVLDPARTRVVVARARDALVGTETTSSLASRRGAIAAVNGGFFRTTGPYRGEPVGALVLGGKLLSEPSRGRPALVVCAIGGVTRAGASELRLSAALVIGGVRRPVAGFNRPREAGELVVLTPELGATTLTSGGGLEVVVERGRVVSVRDGAGDSAIPAGGFVASASGGVREALLASAKPGDTAELQVSWRLEPPPPCVPEWVVGGGPLLLRAGAAVVPEPAGGFADDFLRRRHPRTAAGVREDGTLVLVAVDGRQPGRSAGMTIEELRLLMCTLGCVEALNLDGGGSTTMVVGDQVVNSPSDATGERPVGDALLVAPRVSAPR